MGVQAKEKFISGVLDAVVLLASTPNIGTRIFTAEFPQHEVRSFVEHKRHRIVYYIQDDVVYVADIWSTRMNHDFTLL